MTEITKAAAVDVERAQVTAERWDENEAIYERTGQAYAPLSRDAGNLARAYLALAERVRLYERYVEREIEPKLLERVRFLEQREQWLLDVAAAARQVGLDPASHKPLHDALAASPSTEARK